MLNEGKSKEESLHIIGARSRDNGRTPMQWTSQSNAGFSSIEPWISIPNNFLQINVETEQNDSDSVLNFYKKLVSLRKKYKIISDGSIEFLEKNNPDILAYKRTLNEEELLIFCNFRAQNVSLMENNIANLKNKYQKLIGNYPGFDEKLRPFEVIVFAKI